MGQSRVGKLYDEAARYMHLYCPKQTEKICFVYFISDGSYIKIGVAENIQKRIKELQIGNPKKLFLVEYLEFNYKEQAYFAEKHLHQMFAKERMSGEWFNVADDYDFLMFIRLIKHNGYGESQLDTEYGGFMKQHWTIKHEVTYSIYGR